MKSDGRSDPGSSVETSQDSTAAAGDDVDLGPLMAREDEALARTVVTRFQELPKKQQTNPTNPYVPPSEQELFCYSGRTRKELHQVSVASLAVKVVF